MKLNMTRRRKVASIVLALMALIWLLWPDRQLARVRALQRDLANESLSQEERDQKRGELRQAMGGLSQSQRQELFADGRQRGNQEIERYHNMPPAEKKKYLDQMIDRQQQFQQRMQQQPNGGPPGGTQRPGSQNRPPSTADDRERRRQQQLDRSTPRERELRDQFRRDLEERRKQRGLPPSSGMPGRPGRG